jgi:phosphatidylserine decarboxylase
MPLTPYGRREVGLATLLAIALAVVANWLFWPLMAVPIAVWLWVLWFFRDPRRSPPTDPALLVSPADGRVSDVTPLGTDSPLAAEGVRVGVFMSIFNVHVNRCPFDGVVERIDHQPGAFFDARSAQAIERNESATIYLTVRHEQREYPVVVRQIAGRVARRIVTDLRPGQQVARGQRIGMIKFGSRCELLVPIELAGRVAVEVGQTVTAGRSVLVEIGKDDRP